MAPRDTQRSRVWRAETELPASPLAGLERCAGFVDRVVGSLWWHGRFPDHTLDRAPYLRPGHGARSAFYRAEPTPNITLPRRYRSKAVILHELVHWGLDDVAVADHGPSFTRLVLDSVEEFCGPRYAELLAEAYVRHRVKVAPPPIPDGDRLDYTRDELALLAQRAAG